MLSVLTDMLFDLELIIFPNIIFLSELFCLKILLFLNKFKSTYDQEWEVTDKKCFGSV